MFRTKKKRMLDYWLDGKNYAAQFFKFNPDIYFRQRACRVSVVSVDVQFLLSDQAIARRHETGNLLLPGVPTFSSFPILQQTNKTLVSLLSFNWQTDRYSKILFSKKEVKKYAGAVNYTAFSYRSWTVEWGAICLHARYWQIAHNVSTINFFSLLINYHSFLLNIQHPLNNR